MPVLKNILVATDLGPCSEEALTQAFELAEALGAQVHVLHVYALTGLPEGGSLSIAAIDDAERRAQQSLSEWTRGYRASGRLGELTVRMGDAGYLIPLVADQLAADLIVLGTHGRRGLNRLLMGSVAESVVRVATCSVLIARPPSASAAVHPAA